MKSSGHVEVSAVGQRATGWLAGWLRRRGTRPVVRARPSGSNPYPLGFARGSLGGVLEHMERGRAETRVPVSRLACTKVASSTLGESSPCSDAPRGVAQQVPDQAALETGPRTVTSMSTSSAAQVSAVLRRVAADVINGPCASFEAGSTGGDCAREKHARVWGGERRLQTLGAFAAVTEVNSNLVADRHCNRGEPSGNENYSVTVNYRAGERRPGGDCMRRSFAFRWSGWR
jgi:hypothetical protein